MVGGRVPKIDKDTLDVLSEEAIIVYLNYLEHLKGLYTQFIHDNFNAGKKVRKITINGGFLDFELERHS